MLAEVVEMFPESAVERGRSYASGGRVVALRTAEPELRASVRGSSLYTTRWRWSKDGWTSECSCPVAPACKHAVAVACVVLAEHLPLDDLGEACIAELLPAVLVRIRLARAGRPIVVATPARAADDDARARNALERLRTSPTWSLRVHALDELVASEPKLRAAARIPPISEYAALGDPDLRCTLIAEACHELVGWIPPVLRPFHERPDVLEKLAERHERRLVEQLEAWLGRPTELPARSLRLVFGLTTDDAGEVVVTAQALLTTSRRSDVPRDPAQLRALQSDVRRDPGLLAEDQRGLLEVLLDPVVAQSLYQSGKTLWITGAALMRVLLGVCGSPLATWGGDLPPELAAAAGVVAGDMLRLAPGSVEIGPVLATSAGEARVELAYSLPGGRILAPSERVVIRGRPSWQRVAPLVLSAGSFWPTRGDPPTGIAELFASSGGLPLTSERTRALVEPLARVFPVFRATLAGHVRTHAARPVVSLDLRDDDWLHLRAFATGNSAWRPGDAPPDGDVLFERTGDGRWIPRTTRDDGASAALVEHAPFAPDTSTTDTGAGGDGVTASDAASLADDASATIVLELPDPERVEPLVAWLEALGVAAGERGAPGGFRPPVEERGVGLWIRLTARNVEQVAEAWDGRPPGVAWFGSTAARRLLEAPVSSGPRVRVESSGVDWFSVSAEWQVEGLSLGDDDLAKLRAAGGRFVRLPSGWTRSAHATAHDEGLSALAELGIEAGADAQRVSVWQLAQARPEALAALDAMAGSEQTLARVRALRKKVAAFKGLRRVAVPRTIEAELREYQRAGLDFLAHTSSLGLGAILADDMGLGKTLQALAFIALLIARDEQAGPSLVVCPASVLHNWEREAARFAPRLRVLALSAGGGRAASLRAIGEHDLVVTNYALLRRDLDELRAIPWRAVILDEAQTIKNPDALVSRAARSLEARHRLALTGTPLENRALDLWSILAFVNPGYLGTRAAFVERYDRSDAPPHARKLLAAKLRPIMLRRLKSQVAPELPPRIEERRDCEMLAGQRKLYLAELAKGRSLLSDLASPDAFGRNKITILALLTRLRQICCHPALVGGKASLGSGKFEALVELLEPILAEGHKVLVFSQFVACLDLLAARLDALGIAHHRLTGASRKRGEIVAAFEGDPRPAVFLVSLKAGGTGLNLTAANYVVLFDPWWNPAVEAQAIDRTHRIGQQRTVIAYRMVAMGTLEERILELQQRKAALARDILGEEGFAKSLTRDDLAYLLADDSVSPEAPRPRAS